MQLIFTVTGKNLVLTNADQIVSGEVNVTDCIFSFDSAWDGYTKTVMFQSTGANATPIILEDGVTECSIPPEITTNKKSIYIGVFGIANGALLNTNQVSVKMISGAHPNFVPAPTEDIYLQIVSMMQSQKVDAQTAIDMAASATASAESALLSKQNALASEENAKKSEDEAKESETNAKNSENAAKTSEENAKISEDESKDARDEAVGIIQGKLGINDDSLSHTEVWSGIKVNTDLLTKVNRSEFTPYKILTDSIVDGEIQDVLHNEVIATDIHNKLLAQETAYAPRLTAVETNTGMAATNYVTNGDFSNTTGWIPLNSTISASGNILTATGGNSSMTNRVYQDTSHVPSSGDKLYLKAKVRLLHTCNYFFLWARDGSGALYQNMALILSNPTLNTWYQPSFLIDITAPFTSTLRVNVDTIYSSTAAANGSVMEVQYVIALNLTKIFGAGNEPTMAEMDVLLAKYTNSWFNGIANPLLNNKDLFIYLNKNKANITQENWITPTLTNAWVAYDTRTAKYKKSSIGRVYLKGIVKSGTIGTSIFTLPVGYRPDEVMTYPIVSNGVYGYVTINTDGTVVCTSGSNASVSLSGINFFV